jgi:hypothetical protein
MHGFCPLSNRYENESAEGSKSARYRERLARGDTVRLEQFEVVIVRSYPPLKIREALRQILVDGKKVAVVGAEVGVPAETLKKRAQRLRKEISERFPRSCLHPAVEAADNRRDSRFQQYQFQKGLLRRRWDGDYDGYGKAEE